MKKLFAVLALAALMTACKDKKKEEKKPDATTTTTTEPEKTTDPGTTTTTTTTTSGVPTFDNAEVQQYVNDYTAFINSYIEAYKGKDYTKIAAMAQKMSDWSSRSMSVAQKLAGNQEDAMKFSNYVSKLSDQLTAAMQMK